MDIIINGANGKYEAILNGRLDTTNADKFQQDIAPLMEGDKPEITIDCSGMDYTSSQGLRIFLMLQKSVTARGGSLTLKDMKPQVKEVFDITGFSSIIKIV